MPPPLYKGLKAAVTDSLMQLPNYNVNALIGNVLLGPGLNVVSTTTLRAKSDNYKLKYQY